MALKDWKDSGKDYWIKKGELLQLYIRKNKKTYSVMIREVGTMYGPWHTESHGNFTTKSQALKFAKSYMRTH